MIKLVQADIISTVLEIVEEVGPEYSYQFVSPEAKVNGDCLYLHTDPATGAKVPGCIVARILVKHGFSHELLAEYEGDNARNMLISLRRKGMLELTEGEYVITFLQTVQRHQDEGTPWAEAVQRTQEYIESL